MKRPITLIAGIISTVANAIITVLMTIGLVAILDFAGGMRGVATVLIIGILELVVFVIALIMSIISITAWEKDSNGFRKKKGVIITGINFNIIGAVISILAGSIGYIILAIVLIATAILWIVDLALEGKRATPVETQF